MNIEGMKILIIEDDLLLAEELQEQLEDLGYDVVGIAGNSDLALQLFRERKPDLVLCDIHLENSKLDGIQIVQLFNDIRKVPVVFLTAYGDKLTIERAKKVDPAYYLIKPSNITQLKIALDFAIYNFVNKLPADIEHSLSYHNPPLNTFYFNPEFFFAKKADRYIRISINDILWVEALGGNVQIFTENNKFVLALKLNSFLKQIQSDILIRTHRSYVVNINKVVAFDKGRIFLEYHQKQKEIPIGNTYKPVINKIFLKLKSD